MGRKRRSASTQLVFERPEAKIMGWQPTFASTARTMTFSAPAVVTTMATVPRQEEETWWDAWSEQESEEEEYVDALGTT